MRMEQRVERSIPLVTLYSRRRKGWLRFWSNVACYLRGHGREWRRGACWTSNYLAKLVQNHFVLVYSVHRSSWFFLIIGRAFANYSHPWFWYLTFMFSILLKEKHSDFFRLECSLYTESSFQLVGWMDMFLMPCMLDLMLEFQDSGAYSLYVRDCSPEFVSVRMLSRVIWCVGSCLSFLFGDGYVLSCFGFLKQFHAWWFTDYRAVSRPVHARTITTADMWKLDQGSKWSPHSWCSRLNWTSGLWMGKAWWDSTPYGVLQTIWYFRTSSVVLR